MVRLSPMTATDLEADLEEDTQRYAQKRVRAGDWLHSEALPKSREEHQQLLPDGLATLLELCMKPPVLRSPASA